MFRLQPGLAPAGRARAGSARRPALGEPAAYGRSVHSAAASAPAPLRGDDEVVHALGLAQVPARRPASQVWPNARRPRLAVPPGPGRSCPGLPPARAAAIRPGSKMKSPLGEPGRQVRRHSRIPGCLHVQHGPPAGLGRPAAEHGGLPRRRDQPARHWYRLVALGGAIARADAHPFPRPAPRRTARARQPNAGPQRARQYAADRDRNQRPARRPRREARNVTDQVSHRDCLNTRPTRGRASWCADRPRLLRFQGKERGVLVPVLFASKPPRE